MTDCWWRYRLTKASKLLMSIRISRIVFRCLAKAGHSNSQVDTWRNNQTRWRFLKKLRDSLSTSRTSYQWSTAAAVKWTPRQRKAKCKVTSNECTAHQQPSMASNTTSISKQWICAESIAKVPKDYMPLGPWKEPWLPRLAKSNRNKQSKLLVAVRVPSSSLNRSLIRKI